MESTPTSHTSIERRGALLALLGPLGVVFGDIGTSPLYAFREAAAHVGANGALAIGIASVFFWTLTIVITGKYALLILRADHEGQGGIFALLGLLRSTQSRMRGVGLALLTAAITFGAALLFAEGVITPAISVLSAWEGLSVTGHVPHTAIILLTIVTLLALAFVQHRGTASLGNAFGYVMLLWFAALIAIALPWIIQYPTVLRALDPRTAWQSLSLLRGMDYLHLMGAVMLCITGGEALYADMGHFTRSLVRRAWGWIVFPSLACNYLGQAARVLDPTPIPQNNTFFGLVPDTLVIPMVVLATAAAIIASQALISGGFSIANQAVQLGILPRVRVVHTSANAHGQIFVPIINRAICIGAIILALGFGSSSALSSAYGLAVSGTMTITTIGFLTVARNLWRWPLMLVAGTGAVLLLVDLNFLLANIPKFLDGGWLPFIVAVTIATILGVWRQFRAQVRDSAKHELKKKMSWLLNLDRQVTAAGGALVDEKGSFSRSARAFVFLCSSPVRTLEDPLPLIVRVYLKRHGVLPGHMILLHVNEIDSPKRTPQIAPYEIIPFNERIYSVVAHYGYLEQPHIGVLLEEMRRGDPRINVDANKWTVVVGEEEIILGEDLPFYQRFRAWVFRKLLQEATPAHFYFGVDQHYVLAPQRRVESTLPPINISKEVIRVEVHEDRVQHVLPSVELAEVVHVQRKKKR